MKYNERRKSVGDTDNTISRIDARLDALETRVTALESSVPYARGTATLSAGTIDVTVNGIPSTALVYLTPKSLDGTPGFLSSQVTADTLTINSSDIGDKSVINYLVFTAP